MNADAPGTHNNRITHERSYMQFCKEFWYAPYPATNWRQCQYAMFLNEQHKVPETNNNYVGSLRVLHKSQGIKPPQADDFHFQNCLRLLKNPVRNQ